MTENVNGKEDGTPTSRQSPLARIETRIPEQVWNDVSRLIHQILGPLGEAGDWLSDQIRLFRYQSAIKTLTIAKEIAERENIRLTQVPLKFLVPFLEKSSLEEEDSDLLSTWANLLVSAGIDYSASHPVFVDMLSQISGSEARLLRRVWESNKDSGYNQLSTLLNLYKVSTAQYYGEQKVSIDEWERRGFLVLAGGGRGILSTIEKDEEVANNIRSLLVLERQNLIKIQAVSRKHISSDQEVYVVNAVLTPLGYEFVSACERDRKS